MSKKIRILLLFIILVGGIILFITNKNHLLLNFKENTSIAPIYIGQTHLVLLTASGFEPTEVTISAGDQIEFKTTQDSPFWPASDLHPSHGIYPEFDPQQEVSSTDSWTFQFLKNGRWKYHDHLRPQFRGVIVVK